MEPGAQAEEPASPLSGIKVTSTATVMDEVENIKCLVYIGLPENPQFLGSQDPDALAQKILESKFLLILLPSRLTALHVYSSNMC